ncbi:hypothetical protein AVEN_202004-1 [Araneus ventricosus]|uniref:Uncharacterized protein n=1 Tax=Araneus ventricosus TaxID=182803 RepID=A0A4Y2J8L0_ARAVE|nr:hypothetical protein AVEN_202004-1 [Araneus ventricosus]
MSNHWKASSVIHTPTHEVRYPYVSSVCVQSHPQASDIICRVIRFPTDSIEEVLKTPVPSVNNTSSSMQRKYSTGTTSEQVSHNYSPNRRFIKLRIIERIIVPNCSYEDAKLSQFIVRNKLV